MLTLLTMRNHTPRFHKYPNCTKCLRPFTEGNPRACNGHRTECRECFNKRHRNWVADNKQYISDYKKALYVPHPLRPRVLCKDCNSPLDGEGKASWKRICCKACWAARARIYRLENPDKIRAKEGRITKNRVERYWQMILDAYGRMCYCCGETIEDFLTLHHINRDGGEHRKRRPGAKLMFLDVIREGFPKGKYAIACMQCNYAMRWGKICPHELIRRQQDVVA